jgi:hypothetical protein
VANIVDQVEPRVVSKHAAEGTAEEMHDGLPIRPGEVAGRSHRAEIRFSFPGPRGRAGELPVQKRDLVVRHHLVHQGDAVRAHLVA